MLQKNGRWEGLKTKYEIKNRKSSTDAYEREKKTCIHKHKPTSKQKS